MRQCRNSQLLTSDPLTGGKMIVALSHLRFAAGVCVLAAGLLMGGAGGAVAVADPDSSGSAAHSDNGTAKKPKKTGTATNDRTLSSSGQTGQQTSTAWRKRPATRTAPGRTGAKDSAKEELAAPSPRLPIRAPQFRTRSRRFPPWPRRFPPWPRRFPPWPRRFPPWPRRFPPWPRRFPLWPRPFLMWPRPLLMWPCPLLMWPCPLLMWPCPFLMWPRPFLMWPRPLLMW